MFINRFVCVASVIWRCASVRACVRARVSVCEWCVCMLLRACVRMCVPSDGLTVVSGSPCGVEALGLGLRITCAYNASADLSRHAFSSLLSSLLFSHLFSLLGAPTAVSNPVFDTSRRWTLARGHVSLLSAFSVSLCALRACVWNICVAGPSCRNKGIPDPA